MISPHYFIECTGYKLVIAVQNYIFRVNWKIIETTVASNFSLYNFFLKCNFTYNSHLFPMDRLKHLLHYKTKVWTFNHLRVNNQIQGEVLGRDDQGIIRKDSCNLLHC